MKWEGWYTYFYITFSSFLLCWSNLAAPRSIVTWASWPQACILPLFLLLCSHSTISFEHGNVELSAKVNENTIISFRFQSANGTKGGQILKPKIPKNRTEQNRTEQKSNWPDYKEPKSNRNLYPTEFIPNFTKNGNKIRPQLRWKYWFERGNSMLTDRNLNRKSIHISPKSEPRLRTWSNGGDNPGGSDGPSEVNPKRFELCSDELTRIEFLERELWILVQLPSSPNQPVEKLGVSCRFQKLSS